MFKETNLFLKVKQISKLANWQTDPILSTGKYKISCTRKVLNLSETFVRNIWWKWFPICYRELIFRLIKNGFCGVMSCTELMCRVTMMVIVICCERGNTQWLSTIHVILPISDHAISQHHTRSCRYQPLAVYCCSFDLTFFFSSLLNCC